LEIQYGDYAVWQREWLKGEVLEEGLRYWREQLQGVSGRLPLPQRRSRPAVPSYRGARQGVELGWELVERLRELGRGAGTTLFMTLLGGFAALLGQYTGQEEVVIGTVAANRERVELEKLIGFFTNALALRVDMSGGPSFRELLKRVREVCLEGYGHQEVPVEKVAEEMARERGEEREPLYEVWFQLDGTAGEKLEVAGLQWEPFAGRLADPKFELSLMLQESTSGVTGVVEYDASIFEDETISLMMLHLHRLLEYMTVNTESSIHDVLLVSAEEAGQLSDAFSVTA